MSPIRDAIGRTMLTPALRLMRAQMQQITDPARLRELAARVDALGHAPPGATSVAVRTGSVDARWISPDGLGTAGTTVLLYLHGGAFIAETPNFHGALLARLCRAAHAHGLMPSYRLAPEHRYPAALDDCEQAYRWLLQQGHDAGRIVVAGDSAGGNLALALLLRLREAGAPLPAGAVAISPVTDLTFSGESLRRNDGNDDMFSADLVDALAPVYLDDPALRTHPQVSPLFGELDGLPPVLLLAGSTELLLDDAVRYAQRCPSAQLLVWHDMPHVFPGFDFLPEAREAVQRIGRFVDDCVAARRGSDAVPAPSGLAAAAAAHTATTGPLTTARVTSGAASPVANLYGPADAAAVSPAQASRSTRHAPPATAAVGPLPALHVRRPGAQFAYALLAGLAGATTIALIVVLQGAALWLLVNPLLWTAGAAVLLLVWLERAAVGPDGWPWCLLATLALGPACGLATFMALRESRAPLAGGDAPGR